MTFEKLLNKVGEYYTGKLRAHGATPQGVDWNSSGSQQLRFEHLLQLRTEEGPFTINDFGCGYGALADFLESNRLDFRYCGYDVSSAMIDEARRRQPPGSRCTFHNDLSRLTPADYCVASGIFNVRLDVDIREWERYVLSTIDLLGALSVRGFAFNALSDSSDPEHRRPDLYYAQPGFLFDYCRKRHSRSLALLHDYGLFEFTLLVKKRQV